MELTTTCFFSIFLHVVSGTQYSRQSCELTHLFKRQAVTGTATRVTASAEIPTASPIIRKLSLPFSTSGPEDAKDVHALIVSPAVVSSVVVETDVSWIGLVVALTNIVASVGASFSFVVVAATVAVVVVDVSVSDRVWWSVLDGVETEILIEKKNKKKRKWLDVTIDCSHVSSCQSSTPPSDCVCVTLFYILQRVMVLGKKKRKQTKANKQKKPENIKKFRIQLIIQLNSTCQFY